jgi:hypothetical protein
MSDAGADPDASRRLSRPPRRRRLSDYVMAAFHSACDVGDLEVAQQLIVVIEHMLRRPPPGGQTERRTDVQPLVAANERLWDLRHPETRDG